MGLLAKLRTVVRQALSPLTPDPDPEEEIEQAYKEHREQLQKIKRQIADLMTQKKRLRIQKQRKQEQVSHYENEAETAVEQGRDDAAKRSLNRKREAQKQVQALDEQIAELEKTLENLATTRDELDKRVTKLRTEKQTLKARREAAKANAQVSETLSGLREDGPNVQEALEEARERTRDMEARALAAETLQEEGHVDSPFDDEDEIEKELRKSTDGDAQTDGEKSVEQELEEMKSDKS